MNRYISDIDSDTFIECLSPEIELVGCNYINVSTPLQNIQTILTFPKEELLTSSPDNTTLYKQPSYNSADARVIWIRAEIPYTANIRDIEYKLLDWAYTFATIEFSYNKIHSIQWKSASNCQCQATWKAFLRWIICASVSE